MWWSRNSQASATGLHYGGVTVEECQKMIHKCLKNQKVKFLMEQMEKSGCPISTKFITAVRCKQRCSGTYVRGLGIRVCSNYLRFQDEVTQVVIHELIHAYDDCRAANLNWASCAHHACAEIRAAHLSGDCHYIRELLRGTVKLGELRGHEPECVRRRATRSVRGNPRCSEIITKLAMQSVWDTCYNDTKPFDKAP
ncbi:Mitochondrial inner membrane protease ATP23 [Sesamum alatum]|uniref:Mitochondrial inner membrane protease ATP23 n=1 Tax=Sesamum alatum TaxID=300844 RepID=A0AAE1XSR5_9LAMI|nr:Mitochondrial inner membrane protease ATP23 [Sesamum alatum]